VGWTGSSANGRSPTGARLAAATSARRVCFAALAGALGLFWRRSPRRIPGGSGGWELGNGSKHAERDEI
jgi:hypothetical protein